MKIEKYQFRREELPRIGEAMYGSKWPIVYLLTGGKTSKKAYVGESINARRRMREHINDPERKGIKEIRIIGDATFNLSATKDLEALLIRYIGADHKYKLQNELKGLQAYDYYQKEQYVKILKEIWKRLSKEGIVNQEIVEIENSDLFKFSPYTSLNDEQFDIIEQIRDKIEQMEKIMIRGGAGTGKSILAVYLAKLLSDIKQEDNQTKKYKIALVIPVSSFRKTIKRVFSSIEGLQAKMVIGPSEVVREDYDIVIVDEAHRLRRNKNLGQYQSIFKKNCRQLGLNEKEATELDWIQLKSKKQILFYDLHQKVKPSDMLDENFEKFTEEAEEYQLTLQMRVKGGAEYINFSNDLMNVSLENKYKINEYDFRVFDDADKMINTIKKLDKKFGLCRNVAGFSWDWDKKQLDKKTIQIENKFYLWNTKTEEWIHSPNAINEIGCIHTVQGYDLNYTGLIFGEEISYDEKKKEIVIRKEKYKDKNGKNGTTKEELEKYIKDIYGIMLKRGMRGTYLYACDEKLQSYLKESLNFIQL